METGQFQAHHKPGNEGMRAEPSTAKGNGCLEAKLPAPRRFLWFLKKIAILTPFG